MQKAFEKIVERLEKLANQRWLVLAERNGYKRAIKIVNQVAEEYEQEVCEWKDEDKDSYYFSNCNKDDALSVLDVFTFKYCPYCGKKIKVV